MAHESTLLFEKSGDGIAWITLNRREVHNAVQAVLGADKALVERIFEIVKAQRDY